MPKIDIAVVDYGMGNLRSVSKALEHVAPAQNIVVTSSADEVARAERVVFPGQGAMPDCIRELDDRGLREAVLQAASSRPFLGICIGLQMLFEHSEEGDTAGLGLFKGNVKRFLATDMVDSQGQKLKVPHMGWNTISTKNNSELLYSLEVEQRFYFVHSFHVICNNPLDIEGTSSHGYEFVSAFHHENIYGVQFHPEKSHRFGMNLLNNFLQV
jgi:glutamine amidotransferase